MNPKRKQRLYLTVFLFLVAGGVTALLIQISGENMNMFYPPKDVVSGKAPVARDCGRVAWSWMAASFAAPKIWV